VSLRERREVRVMHGQYITIMHRQIISEEYTFPWLSRAKVKGETEIEIIAAQYQALQIKCQ